MTQLTDWDVEARIEGSPSTLPPISFVVESETLLGRTPNGQAEMPSIDLSAHNAADLGVSRRHGLLRNEGAQLTYMDYGSGNGSSLNGVRLEPKTPRPLATGDRLQLGQLALIVNFKARPRKTSVLAMRPGIQLVQGPIKGTGQRLLVVEDDQGLAEMYRLALERSGYVVQTAREMVTAIRALNHQMPSAILLDMMLPGIRGVELARYVRRDTECPDVPIIVVSALRDKDTVKAAIDAGVDVYMGKPVDWKELSQVVGSMVNKIDMSNSMLQTKKLRGTARLEAVPADVRRDTIIAFIDSFREPITISVQGNVTLGRQATMPGSRTHIDLEQFEAFDKGVSRVHATLRRINDVFEVEDLNSANGTYINGQPLLPGKTHTLKNSDELRLGNLRMRVYFLSETELSNHP
jgi:pSer/pThr/pTyr-binding forkhead associated (FHA) protein